ncbi:MAG: hypothetical protein JJE13_06885 [Thermoleophilia bacterium]|nr:hypothetical protein [Thermoleophilia bacterium]
MYDESLYELEELAVQPGTYFNPQTEVVVIVDDSASIDQQIFSNGSFEGSEWVRVAEETAVDEDRRDELLEEFQARHHKGAREPAPEATPDLDDFDDFDDDIEPDEPPEESPEAGQEL